MLETHGSPFPWSTALCNGLKPDNALRTKVLPIASRDHVTFSGACCCVLRLYVSLPSACSTALSATLTPVRSKTHAIGLRLLQRTRVRESRYRPKLE